MPIPKFSDLSPAMQIVVILVVGGLLWGATEYLALSPLSASNEEKKTQVETLTREVTPLRPFRERVRALEADNQQLENQLANLQRIVPSEKEVDNFVRLLQAEAINAGISLRRLTAQAPVQQQYHVEVPFQMELDGSYFDVLQFYERLGRVERITNVSDLKMGGIQSGGGGVGAKKYDYTASETVVAVCTVTTFFSREQEPAAAEPAPAASRAPQRRPPARPAAPAGR